MNSRRPTFKKVAREHLDWPDFIPIIGYVTFGGRLFYKAYKSGALPGAKKFLKAFVMHIPTLGLSWPSEERRLQEELGPEKYENISREKSYAVSCNCGMFAYHFILMNGYVLPQIVPIVQKSLETLL